MEVEICVEMDYSNCFCFNWWNIWGYYFYRTYTNFINLSENPWINNPYVSVLIGAVLLYVIALFLTDYVINFIKWMEERF